MTTNSSQDDRFNRVLTHLQSEDAQLRKRAINWLAKSGRNEALRPLEWTAQSDPDPTVRHSAQLAIDMINSDKAQVASSSQARQTVQTPVVRPDQPATGETTPSSMKDLRRGTGLLRPPTEPKRDPKPANRRPPTAPRRPSSSQPGQTQVLRPPTEPRRTTDATKPDTDASRKTLLARVAQMSEENPASQTKPTSPKPQLKGNYFRSKDEELATVIENYAIYDYSDPDAPDYVSRENYEKAQELIAQAHNQYIHKEPYDGVIETIVAALRHDPHVKDLDSVKEMAIGITKLPELQAIQILVDDTKRSQYLARRLKQARYGIRVYSTWAQVGLSMSIFAVVQFVGMVSLLLILSYRAQVLLEQLQTSNDLRLNPQSDRAAMAQAYIAFAERLAVQNIWLVLIYSLVVALSLTALLLVGNYIAHFVARWLEGTATAPETHVNLMWVPAWVTSIIYITSLVVVMGLYPERFGAIGGVPEVLLGLFRFALLFPALIFVIQQVNRIGYTHDLTTGRAVGVFIPYGIVVLGGLSVVLVLFPLF
jgi:tetrahydromethanopterin S-methyltransferase subunit F